MEAKIFVNNPWQEISILLWDETREACVIDCGCYDGGERKRMADYIAKKELKPVLLLCTHLHIDHIFGNGFMKDMYGLSATAHRGDEMWIEQVEGYARALGVRNITPPPPVGRWIEEGEEMTFGHTTLQTLHVPGHSAGSLCFYHPESGYLFGGDVLFQGSIGRSDLPGGDEALLVRSIREKLWNLPDETIVIPGHGNHTTIGEEKQSNPFVGINAK